MAILSSHFVVYGHPELARKLKAIRRQVTEGARTAVRAGSTPMLQAIKPTIPRGPTGNLKRSLRRKINRNRKFPGKPYTANIFIVAPHVYLVRFGTKGPRRVKRKRVMSNMNRPYAAKGFIQRGRGGIVGGRAGYYRLSPRNASSTWGQSDKGTFFGKQVARMPENPSFSRAFESHKDEFIARATETINEILSREAVVK